MDHNEKALDRSSRKDSRSRRARRGEATRRALANAARRAFGEHGYDATAVDDIVERAGVTKGAFYYHFEGKRDIFLLVFEEVKREVSRSAFVTHAEHEPFEEAGARRLELDRFLSQGDEAMWAELRRRCRRYIELQTAPAVRRIVLVDAPSVLTWKERKRIDGKHGVVLLRADLRRAMRRELIDRLPLRVVSTVLEGALNEACMLVANAENHDRAIGDAMAVIERFLEGLRSAPG